MTELRPCIHLNKLCSPYLFHTGCETNPDCLEVHSLLRDLWLFHCVALLHAVSTMKQSSLPPALMLEEAGAVLYSASIFPFCDCDLGRVQRRLWGLAGNEPFRGQGCSLQQRQSGPVLVAYCCGDVLCLQKRGDQPNINIRGTCSPVSADASQRQSHSPPMGQRLGITSKNTFLNWKNN